MVLVVPIEEQMREGIDKDEAKATEPRMQNPKAECEGKAQETKLIESLQLKNAVKDSPPKEGEVKKKPAQKLKRKKVNTRNKAERQTHTITVKVPARSKEVKDVGATAKRTRGRPKKVPEENSLDPRKGSVPCPGEGVCADPRSEDATFGVGGPGPPTMDNERQLSLDKGEEKT
jgi:hypothetical protein